MLNVQIVKNSDYLKIINVNSKKQLIIYLKVMNKITIMNKIDNK